MANIARIVHSKTARATTGADAGRVYGEDWNAAHILTGLENIDNTSDANKPISTATQTALDTKANTSSLAAVATSGSYPDLLNKPTIPAAQVNSDWNAGSGVAQILNKPTLGTASSHAATDFALVANNLSDLASASASRTNLGIYDYDTVAIATAATIPAVQNAIRTGGYAAVGDGGGALYARIASQPTHNGKFQSADGAWWELSEVVPNEVMFGAVSTATNAVQTAAIQSMFDYVAAKPGRKGMIVAAHTITSGLTLAGGVCIEWGQGGQSTFGQGTLLKGFNGDMITMGNASVLIRPQLNGVGATYTGAGIVVTGNGDQVIKDGTVVDMAGPCISVPTTDTCSRMRVEGGVYYRHTTTDPAFVLPTAAETVGARMFLGCMCPNSVMMDIGGANDLSIIGGVCTNLLFSSNAKKVRVTGVRIANAAIPATLTVSGIQHSFAGNIISGDVTLTGSNIGWGNDNIVAGTLSDTNTGSTPNTVSIVAKAYTPAWTAATTNPTIGNGSVVGEYERDGNYVVARVTANFGSTTTFGTGTYSFSLPITPYAHARDIIGPAFAFKSGTSFFEGVAYIVSGSSTVLLLLGAAPANNVGPTVPVTWASGDRIEFEIRYRITSTGNT